MNLSNAWQSVVALTIVAGAAAWCGQQVWRLVQSAGRTPTSPCGGCTGCGQAPQAARGAQVGEELSGVRGGFVPLEVLEGAARRGTGREEVPSV